MPVEFIKDGTSSTAAFSEWILGTNSNLPVRRTYSTANPFLAPGQFVAFADECRSLPDTGPFTIDRGVPWFVGGYGHTVYNHALEPNAKSCTNAGSILDGAWTASSFHPGGVNVGFADGHVSMIGKIDVSVWRTPRDPRRRRSRLVALKDWAILHAHVYNERRTINVEETLRGRG